VGFAKIRDGKKIFFFFSKPASWSRAARLDGRLVRHAACPGQPAEKKKKAPRAQNSQRACLLAGPARGFVFFVALAGGGRGAVFFRTAPGAAAVTGAASEAAPWDVASEAVLWEATAGTVAFAVAFSATTGASPVGLLRWPARGRAGGGT
jgi:hypothetical protein